MDRRWTPVAVLGESLNAWHCLWKHQRAQSSKIVPHIVASTSVLYNGEEDCTASVSWFVPVALPVDNAVMLQWAERLCLRVESFNVGKTNLTCHEPFTPTLSSPSHLPHVFAFHDHQTLSVIISFVDCCTGNCFAACRLPELSMFLHQDIKCSNGSLILTNVALGTCFLHPHRLNFNMFHTPSWAKTL